MLHHLFTPSAAAIWAAGLAFGLLHTITAGKYCRDLATRLGIAPHRYRLLYSLAASILTAAWLWLVHALPDAPLYHVDWPAAAPLLAMQLAGLVIILCSMRAFDAGIFLGLKAMPAGIEPFHETGIYRHIRHPMYSGFMLLMLASPVHSVNSLHFALAVCAYFVIGSRFEEARMLAAHPAYADYVRRVPAFVPRVALLRHHGAAQ